MTLQSDQSVSELLPTDKLREATIAISTRARLLVADLTKVAAAHGKSLAVRFDTSTASSCTLCVITAFLDPGEVPPLGFAWTIYTPNGEPSNVQA